MRMLDEEMAALSVDWRAVTTVAQKARSSSLDEKNKIVSDDELVCNVAVC